MDEVTVTERMNPVWEANELSGSVEFRIADSDQQKIERLEDENRSLRVLVNELQRRLDNAS